MDCILLHSTWKLLNVRMTHFTKICAWMGSVKVSNWRCKTFPTVWITIFSHKIWLEWCNNLKIEIDGSCAPFAITPLLMWNWIIWYTWFLKWTLDKEFHQFWKVYKDNGCRVRSKKNCTDVLHSWVNTNQKTTNLTKSANNWHLSHSKMVQNLYVNSFLLILEQILSNFKFHKIPRFSKQKIIETKIKNIIQKMFKSCSKTVQLSKRTYDKIHWGLLICSEIMSESTVNITQTKIVPN